MSQEVERPWSGEADLEQDRHGDRRTDRMARPRRQATIMTLKWIADRLKLAASTHLINRLYRVKN